MQSLSSISQPHTIAILLVILLSACTQHHPPSTSSPPAPPSSTSNRPLTPEETGEMLTEVGNNWLYGNGVGETALNMGAVIVFPPYAVYLIGNSLLEMGGMEPLHFADALPEEKQEGWNQMMDTVTAAPGKVAAAVAGREFRTRDRAKETVEQYLAPDDNTPDDNTPDDNTPPAQENQRTTHGDNRTGNTRR